MIVDEKLYIELKDFIINNISWTTPLSDDELRSFIEEMVLNYSEIPLKVMDKVEIANRIYNSLRGYDILQPLIDNSSITEIMVNGVEDIFIEEKGEVIKLPIKFESQEKLEDIIQSIVAKVNRVVNEFSPIVDARLKDGSRVNVVLPPISLNGPTMTIRKFPEKALTMDDLIELNAINEEAAIFLKRMVIAKYNIFIGGGTGAGKTTFLNVLSNYIPKDERIITIEDSAELQIKNIPNLIRLETRNANTEGKGEISIRELIRASLRMRPDRIIVGEVRGKEALDMLQAMNTGHDGSLSTGHANSVVDMISRIETMVLSGANLPVEVIRQQISSAIDIMVHLSRLRDHSRKVTEISEVIGFSNGEILVNPIYSFREIGETEGGKIVGELYPTGNNLKHMMKLKMAGLVKEGGNE